jgi:hypothetical protein
VRRAGLTLDYLGNAARRVGRLHAAALEPLSDVLAENQEIADAEARCWELSSFDRSEDRCPADSKLSLDGAG